MSITTVEEARAAAGARPERAAAALVLTLAGLLGLATSREGAWNPVAELAWLALAAPALGVLAGGLALRRWALLPPSLWGLGLVLAARGRPDLSALDGALAAAGLYGLGAGLGAGCAARPWRAAGATLLVTGLLAALPGGGGALERPWPPRVAARLLDLSPVTLVLECAGLDWMRHPATYGPAGTMDIGPELRSAWRGSGAALAILLAGGASVLAGGALAARRSARLRQG